jgi:pimeloyl-ACP methyl ester carboxylesterase
MAAGGIFPELKHLAAPRLVLIGSPSSMGEVFAGFASMVGLGRSSVEAMRGRAMALVGAAVEDLDGVTVARRIDRPLLVVHAEDDKEVNVGHAQRYIGVSKHVRHLWANGHGHRRIVSAPEVIDAIRGFFAGEDSAVRRDDRAVS